jgi:hypothetical protein
VRTAFLLAFLAAALCAARLDAGGCYSSGYSYSSYSYPSYSYPVSYETIKYVDRVKYVDRPVYVAQYSPLLVTVPTYSVGYAAPAAPAGYGYPQQQAAPAASYGQPQTAAPAATPQPQAAPCAAATASCEARAARLEAEVASIKQMLAAGPRGAAAAPEPLPREREQPRQARAPKSGLEVMALKCGMCHDERSAKKDGGDFLLVRLAEGPDGKQRYTVNGELTAADWQKAIDQVSEGKMPRKPREVSEEEFKKFGRLDRDEYDALVRDAREYMARAKK